MLAEQEGDKRHLAWITVIPDGSISVGLFGAYQVPTLEGSLVEDGETIHRQVLDLQSTHGPAAVRNPHFTFHPACRYQLSANHQPKVFSGLLMVDEVVKADGILSWITLVSRPFSQLEAFRPPQGLGYEFVRWQVPGDRSVEMRFDFVRDDPSDSEKVAALIVNSAGRKLRVSAKHVEPQPATLWWAHES